MPAKLCTFRASSKFPLHEKYLYFSNKSKITPPNFPKRSAPAWFTSFCSWLVLETIVVYYMVVYIYIVRLYRNTTTTTEPPAALIACSPLRGWGGMGYAKNSKNGLTYATSYGRTPERVRPRLRQYANRLGSGLTQSWTQEEVVA